MKKLRMRLRFFISLCLYLSLLFLPNYNVAAQANFVEEENFYIIYSGNYFNIIVQKNSGPIIDFDIEELGTVSLNFNYISEYNSPSRYMNSLGHLTGKGYSLDNINWDIFGISELERAYINMSKGYLDRETFFDFSTTVFDENKSIKNYDIEALQTAYIEFSVSNWSYSDNVNGLALNIQALVNEPTYYEKLGPYIDYDNNQFVVELFGLTHAFELRFNSFITAITDDGEEESFFAYAFTDGSISKRLPEPADFWISVPYDEDYIELIFSFVCNIETIVIESTPIFIIGILISGIAILTTINLKQKKTGVEK